MFIVGKAYTREDIHDEVGGQVQSSLPTVDGQVVCACLSKNMNPNAPLSRQREIPYVRCN